MNIKTVLKMSPQETEDSFQCVFCFKTQDEVDLISMNSNSLELDKEIFEFKDLINILLHCKVNYFNAIKGFNAKFIDLFTFFFLAQKRTRLTDM